MISNTIVDKIASNCCIVLKNLPREVSNNEIRPLFELFGPVKTISVPRDTNTGKQRGYGFVKYYQPIHAQLAVKALTIRGISLRYKPITVEISDKF
jgi:poly(U)-binding-splicing factor PUF60